MQASLSHYRIVEQIGAGGMGVVFRAHDELLDRDIALKILSPMRALDPSAHKRFHKEALTLSKVNHPNIATVHEFGSAEGSDFLIEEFIEGRSLDVILARGPLPEKQVIDFGCQLADGLAAAHERGVIHCDLKPSNIRVTPDGRLKILDFGLAHILRREMGPELVTETLSDIATLAGTLPYMAPEQLQAQPLDGRTDIWAAGCVLYEMATASRPFTSSGPALADAITHSSPAPMSKSGRHISAALEDIVLKCLEKDPDNRYHSAKQIAVELRRSADAPRVMAVRLGLTRHIVGLGLVLAILVALGMELQPWTSWKTLATGIGKFNSSRTPAPHELYLGGLKQLERWDKSGNLDSAIHSFQQAVQRDPAFALGYSALGEAYWAKYRLERHPEWLDEAERNSRRAAELNQKLPAVYVTLARVHNGRGYYNLALQEVQQALDLEPHDPDALLAQAAVYAGMGRLEEAESAYKKAAALRPQLWIGYYELGVFYFRLQKYESAAAQFERVLQLTPDNAIAHATLGGMLQLLGNNPEAELHLKRSIELQGSYVAYANLGALYYGQRRWADAAAMTKKALEINASDWSAWSNLGLAYEWLGQSEDAQNAFRKELALLEEAAKISPDNPEIQVALGVLYSRERLRDKAVPHIEAALTRSPEDPAILVSAAEAYDRLGDRARAIDLVCGALAKGWTLAQLQDDPGQQSLLRDPRFHQKARQLNRVRNPAP